MGLNQKLVGKTYPQRIHQVEWEGMLAYAQATNQDNPKLLRDQASSVASPMYAAVWWLPSVLDLFFDQDLMADANIGRMVHRSQDMVFLKPVRAKDHILTTSNIAAIEKHGTGELLTIRTTSLDQHHQCVMQATAGFYFRGPPDPKRIPKKSEPTPIDNVLMERTLHVDNDQAIRYAKASGDHNPIHLDEQTAKAAGLPRVIVHGLCVMAMAQKVIVDEAAECDPARLRRLAVRFSKPVFPGDDLTCMVWKKEHSQHGHRLSFVMKSQRNEEVIRHGSAEVGE